MEDKRKQARKVPLVRAGLIAVGLFSLLLMLTGLWSSSAKAEDDSALHVFVDGRAVAVESIEAELQGTTATYTDVLASFGGNAVTATSVDVFAPADGSTIDVADVNEAPISMTYEG
ncbi:MAG TPA: hypothetical protein P5121_37200, partial [Caldilineaceae bacterium]|nr:hypothetical protein [Caldilineaceae bacterium]